jgi:hypothetical protein
MVTFFRFWGKILIPIVFLPFSLFALLLFSSFEQVKANPSTYKFTADEKAWMEPFFRGIMLQNQAIYTLCGSKPMTMIPIEAEDKDQSGCEYLSKDKKNRIVFEDCHLLQNWENWEKVKERFPINRYAFFKRTNPTDSKQVTIYFADLTKVALTLQENYTIFKRELGLDFDPLNESLSIENESEFWNKTLDSPALLGLLLGYGIKNAFCFQWKFCNLADTHTKLAESFLFRFSDKPQSGKANLDKLSLPIFASFSEGEDEVIEKYKREREIIKTIYEDRDFLTLTLQKLTQIEK